MEFDEIRQPTLREMFVSQMLEKILTGEVKIGDKLPSERELSEKMKISRSMVHLGLEDLSRMGFIRMEPRKGNYIEDYSEYGNLEAFALLSNYSGSIDDRFSRSMVELRNAIYGGAIKKLSSSHTQDDINQLIEQNKKLEKALSDDAGQKACAEEMKNFEVLVAKLCGNPIFPLIINSFGKSYLSIWEKCLKFWGEDEINHQEKTIIEFIRNGEGYEGAKYIEDIFSKYLSLQ